MKKVSTLLAMMLWSFLMMMMALMLMTVMKVVNLMLMPAVIVLIAVAVMVVVVLPIMGAMMLLTLMKSLDDDSVNTDNSAGSGSDDGGFIDGSNESGDNFANDDVDESDSMAKSCELNQGYLSFGECGIQHVANDKGETDDCNPAVEFEAVHNTDGRSFTVHNYEAGNAEHLNKETTNETVFHNESPFKELAVHSYSEDHSSDNIAFDYGGGNNSNYEGIQVGIKQRDEKDEKDIETSSLVKSINIDDCSDSSTAELFSRPVSSMTDGSNNDDNSVSDSPNLPLSLSERLFKKYNPEKSESDDFEILEEFIVDDDDEDLEEEVFEDPGYQEEFDFVSDKENDDCIEIATPGRLPFLKRTKSVERIANLVLDFRSRPKSVLEDLLTPYSSEKNFKTNRERLAKDLFEMYNTTVFDNQLSSDFQITWNKKMRSTAGFCYYSRKNGLRMSRIELADKVIDSADRLRDTLIHEMCHAASWIISGVKAGHGPVWKKWTTRANFVHQDLPPISRCHSYTINTKYTYRCTKCSNTFGRHSKSVNLEKSRCAYCHGRLELVPQVKKDGTPQTRTPSRFALFVKENFARIKKGNEAFSHQDVMRALSSEFAKLNT
ncbi:unnamed protein product [Porites evermanni]|uniref:SprT-like domain-containing protein n=1 Tax=Porites evermanni TaxID=104178 RepID=A0ABN8S6G7_9CNID|nr:unnamed protein product [Porites evermanni]